jgi:hypothetical protein
VSGSEVWLIKKNVDATAASKNFSSTYLAVLVGFTSRNVDKC